MNKHWINGLRSLNKIDTHHDVIDKFIKGIELCGFCCAMYNPDDELVFATESFVRMFDVQPFPQTFETVAKHCIHNKIFGDHSTEEYLERTDHIRQLRRKKPVQSFEVNLTNGIWLLMTEVTFDNGWLLVRVIDTTELKKTEISLMKARDEAIHFAETDSLTQLLNRGGIMKRLENLIAWAEQSQKHLSISLIDLDYFKSINDRFGHTVGDKVLQHFAQSCRSLLRAGDEIGRVGGEEFLLVMPQADETAATRVLDRLQAGVHEMLIQDHPGADYTFSAGVIAWSPSLSLDALYHQADQVLYHAKRNGRNQVCNSSHIVHLSEMWD